MTIKNKLFILILIFVILVGVIFLVLNEQENKTPSGSVFFIPTPLVSIPVAPTPAPESLGAEIFEKSQNPMKDNIPQVNPFEAKTNPFKEDYVNPFAK